MNEATFLYIPSYLSDNYDDKYGKHIAIHSNYVSSDLLPEHDIQLFQQPVKQIIFIKHSQIFCVTLSCY